MRNIIIGVVLILVAWDFFTTYFGTLSIFVRGNGVAETMNNAEFIIHIGALIFALGLDAFIICYKIILNAKNKITTYLLYTAFIYDFATSAYGTSEAMGGGTNIPALAIVILFSLMTTAAPLLITQVLEDSNRSS